MNLKYLFVLIIFLVQNIYGQEKSKIIVEIPTNQKPWNNLEWKNDPDRFQFAIVSDRTGGHRPGIFPKGIRKLNLLQPEFVMSVGDLIEGYTQNEEVLDKEWQEFNGFIAELNAPFFYIPGNHDITNKVMEDKWKELFGVTYYHFRYKDVLFLCLNSEDNYRGAGRGTIDDEQFEYIQKTLQDNQDVKWTLVFLHQPLWIQEDTRRWKDVETLLQDRPHNVFAGHYHRYWKTERNNGKYIALATTGGGSRLRGAGYGEFDHVVWVTMTEEGPLLANLFLDGIYDENVVTDKLVDLVRNTPFPAEINQVYTPLPNSEIVETTIRITNNSDYPMQVTFDGDAHPDLFYTVQHEHVEVPPNDVVIMSMTIKNINKVDFVSIEPIKIDAKITYAYEGNTDVVFSNTLQFLPAYKNNINPTTSRMTVDGYFSDWNAGWNTLAHHKGGPFDYSGAEDCTVKFNTTYDDDYLYFAIQVMDDEIYKNQNAQPWNQDALVIALDGRPKELSEINTGDGRGKEWLAIFINPEEKNGLYQSDKLPEGTRFSINQINGGTNIELAIPLAYLDMMQMKTWESFRLGLGYYDFDDNGESKSEHFWCPAWSSDENYIGSGMFFRN